VSCRLEGDVPGGGMIMDFGVVKDEIRELADELDHRWMLPREPSSGEVTVEDGRIVYEVDGKRWDVPESDVALVEIPVCTAEFLANLFADRLLKQVDFPEPVDRIEVGVDEGHGKGAWATRHP
jgi:6-pyruvoyl-tetrahydropterin synthase